MIDYNYYVQYQNNLNKALQILEDNTSTNNYCEEAKSIIKSLMTYKDIYKKKYGENSYVLVGKLTNKNEILFAEPRPSGFDIPLSSNLKTNDNKAKSVGVYSSEWYYIELEVKGEKKTMKYIPIAPYEVTNRYSFNQLVYPKNPHYLARDEDPVLGYSLGDWKNAEVVFYDQYIK